MRISFGVYENSYMFDSESSRIQRAPTTTDQCASITSVDQIVSNVVSISSNLQLSSNTNATYFVRTRFSNLDATAACRASLESVGKRARFRCVFWDYEASDWSSNGCLYSTIDNDESPDVEAHECACNHMTSFAILMVNSLKCQS